MESCNVIIIGAGAAGLSCAGKLIKAGLSVVVLEARDRIGGRVHTIHDAAWPLPIELGSEFVHGESPEIERLISAGMQVTEAEDDHYRSFQGNIRPLDVEAIWTEVAKRLEDLGDRDLTFADFLVERCVDLDREVKEYARGYVEGFQSADTGLVSSQWVRDAENASGASEGFRRIPDGYDQVIRSLLSGDAENVLRLNHVVKGVKWSSGKVKVETITPEGPREFAADRAVVTVPLSVLSSTVSR